MASYKEVLMRGKTGLETSEAPAMRESLQAAAQESARKALVLKQSREMAAVVTRGFTQAASREAEQLTIVPQAEDPLQGYEDEEDDEQDDDWEDDGHDDYICGGRRRGHRARCPRGYMGPRNAYDGRRA